MLSLTFYNLYQTKYIFYISATSSVAVGLLLAAVQVDVVGLGPRLGARGGALSLPLGPVLAVRQVPVVVADGRGTPERGVTQPH